MEGRRPARPTGDDPFGRVRLRKLDMAEDMAPSRVEDDGSDGLLPAPSASLVQASSVRLVRLDAS